MKRSTKNCADKEKGQEGKSAVTAVPARWLTVEDSVRPDSAFNSVDEQIEFAVAEYLRGAGGNLISLLHRWVASEQLDERRKAAKLGRLLERAVARTFMDDVKPVATRDPDRAWMFYFVQESLERGARLMEKRPNLQNAENVRHRLPPFKKEQLEALLRDTRVSSTLKRIGAKLGVSENTLKLWAGRYDVSISITARRAKSKMTRNKRQKRRS